MGGLGAMKYFTTDMTFTAPEPHHKLRFIHGMVTLQQKSRNRFCVRYGKQVDANLSYGEAASKLGEALMHQLCCDGELEV